MFFSPRRTLLGLPTNLFDIPSHLCAWRPSDVLQRCFTPSTRSQVEVSSDSHRGGSKSKVEDPYWTRDSPYRRRGNGYLSTATSVSGRSGAICVGNRAFPFCSAFEFSPLPVLTCSSSWCLCFSYLLLLILSRSSRYTIVCTRGTASTLENAGVSVTKKLNDRAKTLHPNIHGGILARRDVEHHMEAFNEHGVGTFDVVVINLYPFYDKVTAPGGISFEDGIENIDIGGAAMIKAVAKNHKDVLIVVDSEDYQAVLEYLKGAQNDQKFRRKSAWNAFQHIAAYDSAVSEWLWKQTEGPVSVLRYGVELAVADKSDEAVYVGSGGEITKLTNIRAAEAGHLHTFTISSIFNKRNCPPVPDFVVDGVSSLTINVCAGPPDNENEPAGETTAGGASVTNLLIPTSLKQPRRHALHRLKRIVVSHGVGS
ncbi:hypothetical protein IGI04_009521 [Brassica rapa subsp. trilocularis]|uniref:MGS-like domain-containing protein n=1 Tax=Brassica rapa subsp. trilocularis TaxID=1813537 RepID=A0ABQ7MXN9_BRACM|nr:hypothetical protein IGI04_009521 [Brassica rapa subsp. trilocularis]